MLAAADRNQHPRELFLMRHLLLSVSLLLCCQTPGLTAPIDTLIVLNKDEGSTWLIDPATGKARARLEVGNGPHEAAVSPDGKTAVVCNYGAGGAGGRTLSVIDVPAGKLLKTIDISPHRRPHGIQYMADGRHVLVTSESSSRLIKVDVAAGSVVDTFPSGGDSHMLAIAEGDRLGYATAIGSGTLSAVPLDGRDGGLVTVETGSGSEALALRPGGGEVWVGNNNEHVVKIVNTRTMKVTGQVDCGLQPIRLAFTNDGKFLLAACILSGDLAVIDPVLKKVVKRVPLSDVFLAEKDWVGKPAEEVRPKALKVVREGARPIGIQVGPDGKFVYVANRGLDEIAVVDISSWKIVRKFPAGKGPDGMAWSRIEN
jgi:DNA-binding beta-propeller fold protein YncE